MRTARGMIACTAVAVALALSGCYPPSQAPTDQALPPGGRVVATGPAVAYLWIEDATDDLTTILYARRPFSLQPSEPHPNQFSVYDDETGTTVEIPMGYAEEATGALSPDGRFVAFSSNDPALQAGPTAVNCRFFRGPLLTPVPTYCDELCLYDLDTGLRRPLTGLDGSSDVDHGDPVFSADGQSVYFTSWAGPFMPSVSHRVDLATGEIVEAAPPPGPTSWDRGSRSIHWDAATGTVTSEDATTGEVTTLFEDAALFELVSATPDGRFLVLSHWGEDVRPVHRLVDTDTGTARGFPTVPWIHENGIRYAIVQENVLPDGIDRLVIAPLVT